MDNTKSIIELNINVFIGVDEKYAIIAAMKNVPTVSQSANLPNLAA
jgi:hypothetical protein